MSDDGGRVVVLVGHCGFDSGALKRTVEHALPGCRVEFAGCDEEVGRLLDEADLLLVNRVLDGRFHAGSGVEFIRWMDGRHDGPPAMMLVSNYEDAQDEAVEAGAVRGFGKRELGDEATLRAIREAAG